MGAAVCSPLHRQLSLGIDELDPKMGFRSDRLLHLATLLFFQRFEQGTSHASDGTSLKMLDPNDMSPLSTRRPPLARTPTGDG